MVMQKHDVFGEFSWPSVTAWHFFRKMVERVRFQASLDLSRYHKERNVFLFHIATRELDIHHFSPETKRSSIRWKHACSLF